MEEDKNLIDKCLAGNEEAIEMLVMRYQRMVYTFAYRIVNDMEEAKDVTQKIFIQTIKGIKGFRKEASFKTWLYKIALNVCLNHRRKLSRNEVEINESIVGNQAGALSMMIEHEKESMVKDALAHLPEKQRLAVMLRTYEGLSCAETSGIMGCSESAVKAHYHFGVKRLKEILREKGYEIQS